MAFLQITILLTGNYTFFNWLTLALCLFTLDDEALLRVDSAGASWRASGRSRRRASAGRSAPRPADWCWS